MAGNWWDADKIEGQASAGNWWDADAVVKDEAAAPSRVAVPDMTLGSVARDVFAGALQVGPTAVKGAADLARMATGDRVGKDLSKYMDDGMNTIRETVGSDRALAQRTNFQADMQDDSVGIAQAMLRNKGALADQVLPTVGSMFLPVGVGAAATKLATVGKAAQALDKTALAARVASAQQSAGIGAVAAQNAADTFAELVEKGVPMDRAYLAAGITVPFSAVAGKLTGGGAEVALIKALTKSGAVRGGAMAGAKAGANEGAQEIGEQFGQIVGKAAGTGEAPSLTSSGKELAVAGILGSVVGGGAHVATSPRGDAQASAQDAARAEPTMAGDERDVVMDFKYPDGSTETVDTSTLKPQPIPTVADIGKAASVDDAIAVADQAAAAPPMAAPPISTRAVQLDEADLLQRAMAGMPMDAAPAAVDGAIAQATAATAAPDMSKTSAAIDASPSPVDAANASPAGPQEQPVRTWFGRRGDGYASPEDAQRGLGERQRLQKDLQWRIEPTAEGRYRLAGYAPLAAQARAQAPMTTPVAATQPLGAQPTARAALPQAPAPAAPPVAPVEQQVNVQLGRDQISLSDGGKPFATQEAARAANSAQPMMRVVRVKGGFALADKTPAQLAAQQKAAARLSSAQTSARGEPIPAHAFIAAAGGLSRATAADLGIDGNPRIGNRFLFSDTGRGLSMEQARERLVQEGYLGENATLNDAYALVKLSLSRPQYTPEGVERMAQAESRARFEDYLAAQQEAARQADEDFDPFAPGQDTGLPDGFTADDLREVGYTEADTPLKSEVRALVAQAQAHGIDTDDLLAEVFEDTRYDPNPDAYYERARDELRRAIAESTGGRSHQEAAGHVQGQPGQDAQRGSDSDVRQVDGAEGAPGTDGKSGRQVTEDLLGEAPNASQQQAADARAAQSRKEQQQRNAAPSADEFNLGMEDARTGREVDPNQQELLATLDENDQASRTTTRAQQVARNVAEAVDKAAPGPARRMKLLRDESQRLDATADGQGQLPDLQATNRQAADMLREAAAESEAQAWSDAGLRFSRAKKADGERMHLDELRAQLDGMGVDNTISERDGVLTISKIVVPQDKRSAGLGSQAMQSIVEYADANGLHIALTPSADFGGNKARLTQFYKRFGFKENKGRAKVYEVSESMVRENPGGRVLFSRSASTKAAYEARIDALFSGEKADIGTRVLDLSDMMGLLGFQNAPLLLNERHLLDGQSTYPEMTAEQWKKVPQWLDSPAVAYEDGGRIVMLAPEAVAGYPVRMVIEPSPTASKRGEAESFQLLVTVFAKTTPPHVPNLRALADGGSLRYLDTKTAPQIWQRAGALFPRQIADLRSRTKILTEKNLAGYRRANDPQRSFAGQQADTADKLALATAQERLESGEDAETIRKETGWHQGADGKWRFEISDADAQLKLGYKGVALGKLVDEARYPNAVMPLADVLDHPALFAAYPGLADLRVAFIKGDPDGGQRGSFSAREGRIELDDRLARAEALPTLLHEIQHGIQNIEGFATGTNPRAVRAVQEDLQDQRQRALLQGNQQRAQELQAEIARWGGDSPAEGYRRSAGEAEARNTQTRQKMTDEERRATPPSSTADVADSDVIVTFNGKEMHNAPTPANATPARPSESPLVSAWTALAGQGDIARSPVSRASDLPQVFSEVAPGFVVEWQSPTSEMDAAWKIYPEGKPDAHGFVLAYKDGRVELNVPRLSEGDGGAQAYVATGNWALNTGRRFAADRYGLSSLGAARRLENLASMAVKFGTAEFMDMGGNKLGVQWTDNDQQNMENLLRAAYDRVRQAVPDIDKVAYDFETRQFVSQAQDAGGVHQSGDPVAALMDQARAAGLPVGRATIARAILTGTFIRGEGLPAALREAGNAAVAKNLSGVLYGRGAPFKSGATTSTIAAAIKKAYGNVLDRLQAKGLVTLAQSQDEAIEAAAQARADKTGQPLVQVREQLLASVRNNVDLDIKRSADGAIQGFYDPQSGQSFLIADGLTEQAAPGVLVHEVGVHMARDTQDARGKEAFDKMIHRAEVLRRMGRGNPFFARVTQRMRDAGETSREEAAAYIAEEYERDRVNAPASVKRWVTDFLAAVRGWLFGKGVLVKASDLGAADIAAIARANVRQAARGTIETPAITFRRATGAKPGKQAAWSPDRVELRFSRSGNTATQGSTYTLPEERFGGLRRKMQDYFIRALQAQEAVASQGGKVSEKEDFYRAEELSSGRRAALVQDFASNTVEPLMQRAAELGVDLEELALYAYAKHAEERNEYIATINDRFADGGSGMTTADANAVMDKVRQEEREQAFEELHQGLMGITAKTRALLLSEGLITADEFDALQGQYQNYIPLRGFERVDERGEPSGRPAGKGFNIRGQETMRALGRSSRAGELIENAIHDYVRAVDRSERNHVGKVFLNFVLANPDAGLWEVDATRTKAALDRQTNKVKSVTAIDKGEDTIAVKVGGREVYIRIHDALLLRAMRKNHSSDTGDNERLVVRALGSYTSLLRNTLTRWNPEFALTNAARDYGFGAMAMLDVLGEQGAKKFTKHYKGAMAAAHRNELNKLDPSQRDWDKYFTEFKMAGGMTAGFYVKNTEEIGKDIRTMMLMAGATPRTKTEALVTSSPARAIAAAGRMLEYAGSVSENAARVAAFRTAREMGKSASEAASIAKNLTTNFDRKGELGQIMNAAYVFYNAAVQGSHRLLKMASNPKVAGYMAGFGAASLALALANADWGGDDPDDGMAYWDKIPAHEKERNLIIMLPAGWGWEDAERVGTNGHYVKIPLQYGLNLPIAYGYAIADVIRNHGDKSRGMSPLKAGVTMASYLAGAFNPFGGSVDLSNGSSIAQAALPSLGDVVVQFAMGTNGFGREVAPFKSPFDTKPDSENYNLRQADGVALGIARMLNSATGGSAAEAGAIDISAGTVENLIRNLSGGTGAFIYDVGNLAWKSVDRATGGDPDIFLREMPLARRVYGKLGGDVDQGIFYDSRKKTQEAAGIVKRSEELDLKIDAKTQALADMDKYANQDTRALAEIRRDMIRVVEDGKLSHAEKTKELRKLRAERDQITREFNEDFTKEMRKFFQTPVNR